MRESSSATGMSQNYEAGPCWTSWGASAMLLRAWHLGFSGFVHLRVMPSMPFLSVPTSHRQGPLRHPQTAHRSPCNMLWLLRM